MKLHFLVSQIQLLLGSSYGGNMNRTVSTLGLIVLCLSILGSSLVAQTTEFTYQGSLKNSGTSATGNFDFEFKLFDAVSGGTQHGSKVKCCCREWRFYCVA
jgi:hypothetical protein